MTLHGGRALIQKTIKLIGLFLLILLLANITVGQDSNSNNPLVARNTEIIGGDSISPMKIEMDFTKNEMVTKTVTVKNTGNTPTTYIFYTDTAGSQKEAASVFDLSETKKQLAAGESYDLIISASVEDLQKYTQPELDALRLKIVRDPETTTPLGYILPINIAGAGENNTPPENKTNSETTNIGTPTAIQNNSIDDNTNNNTNNNNTDRPNNGSNNSGNNNAANQTNPGGNMNQNGTDMKKIALLGLTLCAGLLLAISGIYFYRLKKGK
jgi:hypothetical protein